MSLQVKNALAVEKAVMVVLSSWPQTAGAAGRARWLSEQDTGLSD